MGGWVGGWVSAALTDVLQHEHVWVAGVVREDHVI